MVYQTYASTHPAPQPQQSSTGWVRCNYGKTKRFTRKNIKQLQSQYAKTNRHGGRNQRIVHRLKVWQKQKSKCIWCALFIKTLVLCIMRISARMKSIWLLTLAGSAENWLLLLCGFRKAVNGISIVKKWQSCFFSHQLMRSHPLLLFPRLTWWSKV